MEHMSEYEPNELLVVFFFDMVESAELFVKTRDVALSTGRKLLEAPFGAPVTIEYISEDTGIYAPVMVVYQLGEAEPVLLNGNFGRMDCGG